MVIELVGPAGAGKSTVWELLADRAGLARASVWDLPRPLLATSAIRTLPSVADLVRAARRLPWEEVQQLIRLGALDLFLRSSNGAPRTAIILDEGPVFAFSWFRVIGHPCFSDGRLDAWWRRTLAHWAGLLDVIVLLDAADPLLAHRVRTRAKPHPFRDRPEQDLHELNSAYRREFEWVISRLVNGGGAGPKVISVTSDGAPPDEVADQVLAACRETVHAR